MSQTPRLFHLRQRGTLRVWLVSQVLVQVVFYVAFVGLLIDGLTNRTPEGDLARPGDIVTAIVGLVVVVGLAILRGYIMLQPPLRIDPEAKQIKARLGSWPQPPLSYEEAEAMELRTRFLGQLHLFGPVTDRKGKVDPRGRYPLNLTGRARRADGGEHRLATLLPEPLTTLGDGVVVADRASWGDAIRLAFFLNIRRLWHCRSSSPDPLVGIEGTQRS